MRTSIVDRQAIVRWLSRDKRGYLVVLLAFILFSGITVPDSIGDTTRYASDVINHAQGRESQFWEFGHLLWRPWGHVGYSLFGGLYIRWFGDTPLQAAARFLIQTIIVCSIVSVLLLLSVFGRFTRKWIAVAGVCAFISSNAFLVFSHSGAPYLAALLFLIVALSMLCRAVYGTTGSTSHAVLAGLSFAVACALWFPFSFSGLGLLLFPYVWPRERIGSRRHRVAGAFLFSLVAFTLIFFAAGAAAKGINSISQLAQWIRESDNGWSQSITVMRAATGVPRSLWNLGEGGIALKRWLFSDPYNPTSLGTVILSLGGKLALFYLGIAATLWVLWKANRSAFILLVSTGLPLLLFAVLLFEPSSPERFLPIFPVLYLAFAFVLDNVRYHRVAGACVGVLLGGTMVFNLAELAVPRGRLSQTRRRIQKLNSSVQPGSTVFVMTLRDDLYRLRIATPLDKSLAARGFQVNDVVEVASTRLARWRASFADQAQARWAAGNEVWISERLLAARPEAAWQWVEGDDRRIRWPDLPALFRKFEYDAKILPGADGFLRLACNQTNSTQVAALLRPEISTNTGGVQRNPDLP